MLTNRDVAIAQNVLDKMGTAADRSNIRRSAWNTAWRDWAIVGGAVVAVCSAAISLGKGLTSDEDTQARLYLTIADSLTLLVSLSLQAGANISALNDLKELHAEAKQRVSDYKDYLGSKQGDKEYAEYKKAEKAFTQNDVKVTGLAKCASAPTWGGAAAGISFGIASLTTFFTKSNAVSMVTGAVGPLISSTINTLANKRLTEEVLVVKEILASARPAP